MSELETHLNRLTPEGKVPLRDIAGQLIDAGRDIFGTDWRASREDDSLLYPSWWVVNGVYIDDLEDVVFTGRRYYRVELEVFIADRLANDDVWLSEVAR